MVTRTVPTGWYAVVLLPIGDFETLGMLGTIADTELTKHIPVCYSSDKKSISGWAEGYESGGPSVTKRKFPVMWFDDDQTMPLEGDFKIPLGNYFAWLPAGRLRAFGAYGPDSRPVRGYDSAKSFSERLKRRSEGDNSVGALLSWTKRRVVHKC